MYSAEAALEVNGAELSAAASGVPDAERRFVALYQDRVYALLWRMLCPRGLVADAEDLTQETFVRAFAALAGYRPTAKVSTWLLTIATRLALDSIRRQKHRRRALAARGEEARPSPQPSPAELTEARDAAVRVERAIGSLSPDHQAVIVLRVFHGLDYCDIAEALGVEQGTVKSRLSRARRHLRELLTGRPS